MRTTLIAACGGVGNIGFRGEAGSRQTVSFVGFGPRFWLKPLILLRLKIFHNIPYANRTWACAGIPLLVVAPGRPCLPKPRLPAAGVIALPIRVPLGPCPLLCHLRCRTPGLADASDAT